jgi:ABC-type bacteriocin/lantibiotic exporter with double-glycine peptidase domain
MVAPFVSVQIFNVVIPENLRFIMVEITLLLLVFAAANVGFAVFTNLCAARIGTKGMLAVQAAIWNRIINLPCSFFENHTTEEILQKTKNVERIKEIFSPKTIQIITTNIFSFIYVIMLFYFNAAITFYVLGLFLVLFIVYAVVSKLKYNFHKRGELNEIKKIDKLLSAFHVFFDFSSIAAVYLMVLLVGNIAIGVFVAYLLAFSILQNSIRRLLKAINTFPEAVVLYESLAPILEMPPEKSKN